MIKDSDGDVFEEIRTVTQQLSFDEAEHTFKLVLPNKNANAEAAKNAPAVTENTPVAITPQMKTVIEYLAEYGEMADEDLQELLNIKKTRAYLLARQMHENGLIDIVGRGATKKYKLK